MEQFLPARLFRALLADRFLDYGPVTSGSLPPEFPKELIPPGAEVLGGMKGDRSTIGAFTFPDGSDPVTAMSIRLRHDGFVGMDHIDEGFQLTKLQFLVKADRYVQLLAPEMNGEGTVMTVMVSDGNGPLLRMPRMEQLRFPTLFPPGGSKSTGGGSGGGGTDRHADHQFASTLAPIAVLHHYVPQLTAHGWITLDEVDGGDQAMQWLNANDDHGVLWRGFISAFRNDGTIGVHLYMSTPDTPEMHRRMMAFQGEMKHAVASDSVGVGSGALRRV
jgi:hypothetical protein